MITDSFDVKTPPIPKFSSFYGEQKHLVDTCVITFSKEIYDRVLATFDCKKIAVITTCNGDVPIWKFTHDGMETGFYLSMIGSAMAAQCCIESNWLIGSTKYIMFGSAGNLDAEATAGKFIIPTHAYRDEGMSYHYAPPADYIEIKNHTRLAEIFDGLGLPYMEGRVWTTDAFMRETVGLTALRRSEGCVAVEMELAGVQAVCDFHGLELYDFLSAGDVLSENEYRVEGLSQANHSMDKFYIALEIAKRI
ncbi:MAG: nucleoside phosphorylase [Ruminococcus sp.]|jgi:uridine phosphorylase|nr:nucleoside phosphorylase [Ruminococcus sp.]